MLIVVARQCEDTNIIRIAKAITGYIKALAGSYHFKACGCFLHPARHSPASALSVSSKSRYNFENRSGPLASLFMAIRYNYDMRIDNEQSLWQSGTITMRR